MQTPVTRLVAAIVALAITIVVCLTAAAKAVGESVDPDSCMELVTTDGARLRCPPPETAPVAVAVLVDAPRYTG